MPGVRGNLLAFGIAALLVILLGMASISGAETAYTPATIINTATGKPMTILMDAEGVINGTSPWFSTLTVYNLYVRNINYYNKTVTDVNVTGNMTVAGDLTTTGTGTFGGALSGNDLTLTDTYDFEIYYSTPNTAHFIKSPRAIYFNVQGSDSFFMTSTGLNLFPNRKMMFGNYAYGFNSIKDDTSYNTNDAFLIGLRDGRWGTASRSLIICDFVEASRYGDTDGVSFNFAHPLQDNPTVFIHSAAASTTQWISFAHDGTDGVINTGTGAISFDDENITTTGTGTFGSDGITLGGTTLSEAQLQSLLALLE